MTTRWGSPTRNDRNAMEYIAACDALLFGRVTYEMMLGAWRLPVSWPMPDWMMPFARTIDAAKMFHPA